MGGVRPYGHGLSLLSGWLPLSLQVLAGLAVLAVALRRGRPRWWSLWLPVAAALGVAAVLGLRHEVGADGLTNDPVPAAVWIWTAVAVVAVVLGVAGWPRTGRRRRVVSVLAVPLALLCVGSALNRWVGYFPTVAEAWGAVTAGPMPDEVDDAELAAMAGAPTRPATGALVGVDIPDTVSGFAHREEYVYLPPAWFTGTGVHPTLPAVLMIGGEFNTPTDWIRTGAAVPVLDAWAAAHGGQAPIVVFADAGGAFNNDTQCVDGPRGNSATHLTDEVRPYVVARFGASGAPRNWGVVGWSMGGTCAADLAVTRPELFGTFVDIAGDLGPAVGDRAQTIERLYGGDAAAWARFDPLTVLAAHGPYPDTAGWFANATEAPRRPPRPPGDPTPAGGEPARPGGGTGFGGRADTRNSDDQVDEAARLCAAMTRDGITCTQHTTAGGHTWQVAASSFADAFGWLAERVGGPPGGPPASP